jgi:excisionase family DNA binding protein
METERLTLTIEETAKLLGIGRQLAYDKAKTGEIPVIKIGRRLLVPRCALERLLEQGQVVSPPHAVKTKQE